MGKDKRKVTIFHWKFDDGSYGYAVRSKDENGKKWEDVCGPVSKYAYLKKVKKFTEKYSKDGFHVKKDALGQHRTKQVQGESDCDTIAI